DLHVLATVKGQERPVFNQREIDHMVDVKNLYLGARTVGYTALGAGITWFAGMLFFAKASRRKVLSGYLHANWVFLSVVCAIGLFAALDFNTFWTNFHHIFFTNDLWLLDPRTDILIMMVPSQFFFDLVMRIVLWSLGSLAVLAAASARWNQKLKKQENHGI
ncbi:MAG: DUF1461 domain-containing protein, partial [Christensenellaceae bacterium]|nr:DUF1461 domain-containing protein [Christensenellaceae bacterium]